MCKLEEYGNCDEETKNNKYCIFHKPDKSEEEAKEFYRKFLEKFKSKKERITIESEEIERFIFEETVNCRGYVFPKIPKDIKFSFEYSVFKRDVSFYGATFKRGVRFDKATFEGKASFYGATFEGEASFEGTTFEGDVLFSWATFEGNAWFVGATFEGSVFFGGKRVDSKYKFYSKLDFSNTEFRKGVSIDIPSEWFKIPEAEAEACRVQRICYEREGKKDDADRMFVRERRALRKAKVEEAKAYVRKVEEEIKKEDFHSSRKVERVKKWLEARFKLIKARSKYILAECGSSLEIPLADWTCKYGTDWKRPVILWMLLVFLVFPLLYFIFGGITKASSPLDYLYFSIVTATTLGYGDLQPIGWCRLIASTEAIFGTFMWAVFLVVFTRKYMR